jgi:hypothetical protein
VDAFEIRGVMGYEDDIPKEGLGLLLYGHDEVTVTPEMCARYVPELGDYYVIQSDGYAYVNPKSVFERKYRLAKIEIEAVKCRCGTAMVLRVTILGCDEGELLFAMTGRSAVIRELVCPKRHFWNFLKHSSPKIQQA